MLCNALSCTILLWSEGNISSPIRYLYLPILPETTVSWKYVYGPRHAFVFSGVIITHLSWLFVWTLKEKIKMKRIRKLDLIMPKYSVFIQLWGRSKGSRIGKRDLVISLVYYSFLTSTKFILRCRQLIPL